MELFVKLVGILVWPVVVLSLVILFRKTIMEAFRGGGEIEAFGFKAKWFEKKVAEIIKEGTSKNSSPEQLAERIAMSVELDPRALRILRGLVDEEDGRGMYAYQSSYYRPLLRQLEENGCIKKENKRYFLTPTGKEFTRKYLEEVLKR